MTEKIKKRGGVPEGSRRDTLTVTLFHPAALVGGKYFLKPHHGAFLDDLAQYFSEIQLAVPYVCPNSFPRWITDENGDLAYNYELKSNNIRLFVFPFAFAPLARCFAYWRAIREGHHVFFFSPSIVSIVAGLFLRLFRKPYYAYVSTDPKLFYRERFGGRWGGLGSWVAWTLGRLQLSVLSGATGLLVTGAQNQSLFREKTHTELVSPLIAPVKSGQWKTPLTELGYRFLYVGVITPRKKILETVTLVKELRRHGLPATLDIAGTTDEKFSDYFDEVMDSVKEEAGVIQCLGFIGDQEMLRSLYRKSDFLVLLSEFEGFPKVVYEAMEAGCIPLLSPLPSYEGILKDGDNCLFYDDRSGKEIVELTARLRELSSSARKRMRELNATFVSAARERSAARQLSDMISAARATTRRAE